MFKLAKPFFMHTITPMHAGSGSELGIVDMPIQRERHTGFPKIEGSSLKGAIRESFEEKIGNDFENRKNIHLAFGYDDSGESEEIKKHFENKDKADKEFAGSLGFTDARLLLFPVKSMKGVFAYITCPKVLKRLAEDLKLCENNQTKLTIDQNLFKIGNQSSSKQLTINGDKVVLEEYTFQVNVNDEFKKLASDLAQYIGVPEVKEQLVLLEDDEFKDFVELSTEVITRTKIDNKTGTVEQGALFTEEYLPAEAVMYSLVMASPIFNKEKGSFSSEKKDQEKEVMDWFINTVPATIQIGGNATLGKGLVNIHKEGN